MEFWTEKNQLRSYMSSVSPLQNSRLYTVFPELLPEQPVQKALQYFASALYLQGFTLGTPTVYSLKLLVPLS
jgi:hypothetical protein